MSGTDEIAALAASFYQKQLWVVVTEPADPQAMEARMVDHLRYQVSLEQSGKLFAAGPLFEIGEVPVAGLIVYRAADEAEARRIADADPMHSSGARRYTLRRWMVNEGRITLSIDLSRSRAELA